MLVVIIEVFAEDHKRTISILNSLVCVSVRYYLVTFLSKD
jgi:hypothetical protein